MATKDQLRNRAAGFLGKHRLGQAINNDIKTRLDQAYLEVYADLKKDRLTIWSSAANTTIPDDVMPHVAALMAFNATADIGVSEARYARIIAARSIAKPEIRRLVTPHYESLSEPEDF